MNNNNLFRAINTFYKIAAAIPEYQVRDELGVISNLIGVTFDELIKDITERIDPTNKETLNTINGVLEETKVVCQSLISKHTGDEPVGRPTSQIPETLKPRNPSNKLLEMFEQIEKETQDQ